MDYVLIVRKRKWWYFQHNWYWQELTVPFHLPLFQRLLYKWVSFTLNSWVGSKKSICASLESVSHRQKDSEVSICAWLKRFNTNHLSYFSKKKKKKQVLCYHLLLLCLSLFFNKWFEINQYFPFHFSSNFLLDDIKIYLWTE